MKKEKMDRNDRKPEFIETIQMNFKINLVKNHCVFTHDGRKLLLDTGSPNSYAKDRIVFDNNNVTANEAVIRTINEGFGMEIDGLLGMDILKNYSITIDYPNRELAFDKNMQNAEGIVLNLTYSSDIPVINVLSENGDNTDFFFDTGAAGCSYISPVLTEGLQQKGELSDFHPSIGNMILPKYETNIQIYDREYPDRKIIVNMIAAKAPIKVQSMFTGTIKGIIGYDLLKDNKVILQFPSDKLIVT